MVLTPGETVLTPENFRQAFFTTRQRDGKVIFVTDITRCLRRAYYSYFNPQPSSPQAVVGQLLHRAFASTLRDKIGAYFEVGFTIGLGRDWVLKGRCDMLFADSVYEFKFVRSIPRAKEREGYNLQVQLYCHAFRARKGYLVFVDRDTFDIEIVEVELRDGVAESLLDDARYLADCLEKGVPPGRASPRFAGECEYCEFVEVCGMGEDVKEVRV